MPYVPMENGEMEHVDALVTKLLDVLESEASDLMTVAVSMFVASYITRYTRNDQGAVMLNVMHNLFRIIPMIQERQDAADAPQESSQAN